MSQDGGGGGVGLLSGQARPRNVIDVGDGRSFGIGIEERQ